MEQIIKKCRIKRGWYENTVRVWYEDGTMEDLIRYWPSEIRFKKREFIDLTREEALRLFVIRDLTYIQTRFIVKTGS